mgnify:CR=1 FL=1
MSDLFSDYQEKTIQPATGSVCVFSGIPKKDDLPEFATKAEDAKVADATLKNLSAMEVSEGFWTFDSKFTNR